MLKSLIRSITNIKYELKDMTTKIDRIEERQTNMMLCSNDFRCSNSGGDILHTNSIDETWNFPLTSFDELDGFEQKLLDDGYKLKVVKKQDTYLLLKNYDIHMLCQYIYILCTLIYYMCMYLLYNKHKYIFKYLCSKL